MMGKNVKKIIVGAIVLLIVIFLVIFFGFSKKTTKAVNIRLQRLVGTVNLYDDKDKSLTLSEQMRLSSGQRVETKEESLVMMALDEIKLITLEADSKMKINSSGKKLEIDLEEGNIYFNVTEKLDADAEFDIRTSNMMCGIRGTSAYGGTDSEGNPFFMATDGMLYLSAVDDITGETIYTEVPAGQAATLYSGEKAEEGKNISFAARKFREEDLPPLALDAISKDKALQKRIADATGFSVEKIVALAEVTCRPGTSMYGSAAEELQSEGIEDSIPLMGQEGQVMVETANQAVDAADENLELEIAIITGAMVVLDTGKENGVSDDELTNLVRESTEVVCKTVGTAKEKGLEGEDLVKISKAVSDTLVTAIEKMEKSNLTSEEVSEVMVAIADVFEGSIEIASRESAENGSDLTEAILESVNIASNYVEETVASEMDNASTSENTATTLRGFKDEGRSEETSGDDAQENAQDGALEEGEGGVNAGEGEGEPTQQGQRQTQPRGDATTTAVANQNAGTAPAAPVVVPAATAATSNAAATDSLYVATSGTTNESAAAPSGESATVDNSGNTGNEGQSQGNSPSSGGGSSSGGSSGGSSDQSSGGSGGGSSDQGGGSSDQGGGSSDQGGGSSDQGGGSSDQGGGSSDQGGGSSDQGGGSSDQGGGSSDQGGGSSDQGGGSSDQGGGSSDQGGDDEKFASSIIIAESEGGIVTATVDGNSVSEAETGKTVSLTCTPSSGYTFVNVHVETQNGDAISTSVSGNAASFTMPSEAVVVTAIFDPESPASPETYTVTLITNGGTINSGNIESYTAGVGATLPTDVTKASTSTTEYTFAGWYDAETDGNRITHIGTDATGPKTYYAYWTESALEYTLTVTSSGENGTVSVTIDGQAVTSATAGKTVTVTATPAEEAYFLGWLDNNGNTGLDTAQQTNQSFTFTMPAGNVSLTAEFEWITYDITVATCVHGSVTANKQSARHGETVTLTVSPESGYRLDRIHAYGGESALDVTGSENTYTFTMPVGIVSVTADFIEDTPEASEGLFDGNGNLTKSWDQMITDGIITVSSTSFTVVKPSDMVGKLVVPEGYTTVTGVSNEGSTTGAFNGCSGLTAVVLPDVTSIGDDNIAQFLNCSSLTRVEIPSMTNIQSNLFASLTTLSSVELGNVTVIGDYAFSGCSALTSIDFPDTLGAIESYAFEGCGLAGTITLPENVTGLGDGAFKDCSGITSIVMLGSSELYMEQRSPFDNCTSLSEITFGKNLSSVGDGLFSTTPSLTDVYFVGSQVAWEKVGGKESLNMATKHFSFYRVSTSCNLSDVNNPISVSVAEEDMTEDGCYKVGCTLTINFTRTYGDYNLTGLSYSTDATTGGNATPITIPDTGDSCSITMPEAEITIIAEYSRN